jgi:hypothetical protein
MDHHRHNLAGAVQDAKNRVWGAKHQPSLFIQWASNPQKEVTENNLAECLQRFLSLAAQGHEVIGRERGMITPPIAPPSATPPQPSPQTTSALSSLLADLTRLDRDTLTEAHVAERWETTREKTQTWLDSIEAPGVVVDPGEIDDIPLYDVPISDYQIDRTYTREYRDGYDVDVWDEEKQKRMKGY